MKNNTIYRPLQPNKPDLLRLKTYAFVDFYSIDFFFLAVFGFTYTLYLGGQFNSLDFYYVTIGLYLLIRLWPFVVTNSQIRSKNKKLIDSYQKEVVKYNKKLYEYLKYDKERYRLTGRNDFFDLVDYDHQKLERLKDDQKRFKMEREKYTEPYLIKNNNTNDDSSLKNEINNTIRNYSGICAVLAIQPIPFADIFILTPTQILMGKKIASLRGYTIKDNTIESILKEISGIIGMGIISQQLVIGAYKTFLPFLGGITTIPAVYGLTYGIGKTMDYYIVAKINGTQINKSEIEKIFKTSREIGEREGKSKEKEIQAKAKK